MILLCFMLSEHCDSLGRVYRDKQEAIGDALARRSVSCMLHDCTMETERCSATI